MYDPTPSNSPPPCPSPLSPPSPPPCRPAALSTSASTSLTDRDIFRVFIKHAGNPEAICSSLSLDECDYYDWVAKPAVQARLDLVQKHAKLTNYLHVSPAHREAVDKLRELMRTHKDVEGQRKSANAILRLSPPTSSDRSRRDQNTPPGRILNLPNPADNYHLTTPNHYVATGEPPRAGAATLSPNPPPHPANIFTPDSTNESSPPDPRQSAQSAAADSASTTSSDPSLCDSVCSVVNESSLPSALSVLNLDSLSSPTTPSDPPQCLCVSAVSAFSSPNTSSNSSLCDSVCSVVNESSLPSALSVLNSDSLSSPTTPSDPPQCLCVSAVNVFSTPNTSSNSALCRSVCSVVNASVFSPTFGLSPDQLAQLSNAERKRLISIRNPDGTFTAFDPKNPFAGFQGDHLDFLRDPGRAFEDSEARASVVNLFELVRPVPNCPIDDYELPTLDLDDNTPFPRLDPALFPSPAPEVPLPATPKELADVRMHPDLALTIAKLRDPWLCLPKDGRGRPNKRSIKADGTLRNAFEKVRRALMDAKSLTRTIWRERWDRYEFARLIAEGRFTSPINPTPTPPNSS